MFLYARRVNDSVNSDSAVTHVVNEIYKDPRNTNANPVTSVLRKR